MDIDVVPIDALVIVPASERSIVCWTGLGEMYMLHHSLGEIIRGVCLTNNLCCHLRIAPFFAFRLSHATAKLKFGKICHQVCTHVAAT